MVDLLKLREKPGIRCRHSGGAFGPESRCFSGLHRNQSTGPRPKTCRGDVMRPPIHVDNMLRANAPAALSGPRFPRTPAWREVSDYPIPHKHFQSPSIAIYKRGKKRLAPGRNSISALLFLNSCSLHKVLSANCHFFSMTCP